MSDKLNQENMTENSLVIKKEGSFSKFKATIKGVKDWIVDALFDRDTNAKKLGVYMNEKANVLKFPLLATESIDQNIVSKFCHMLQQERAIHVRTFLYNNELKLEHDESKLAKELDSGFYKESASFEGQEILTESFQKYLAANGLQASQLTQAQLVGLHKGYQAANAQQQANQRLSTQQQNQISKLQNAATAMQGNIDDLNSKLADKSHDQALRAADLHNKGLIDRAKYLGMRNDPLLNTNLQLGAKDLMPVAPQMIEVQVLNANKDQFKQYRFQILGIRYIPHMIPFNEMKVAFKYGILNSRIISRFLKLLAGDISGYNFFTGNDRKQFMSTLTKIASNKKTWFAGLKDSTQAVTIMMSKSEFDTICNEVVDFYKHPNTQSLMSKFDQVKEFQPRTFMLFERTVAKPGSLDLIILDKDAKCFYRINAADGYQMVRYDIRDALNAEEKSLVINTTIEASKLRQEM